MWFEDPGKNSKELHEVVLECRPALERSSDEIGERERERGANLVVMGGEEVGSSVVVGEKKNTEQWRHVEGMKGKRRAEQQAQAQGQQAQGKHKSMPKKRFYRARAHSNPLSDSQFPVYAFSPIPIPIFLLEIVQDLGLLDSRCLDVCFS